MPSNNEILLKYGFNTRMISDRIVRVYHKSTEAQKINGRGWYPNAGMHAKILGESAGSKEHAAAVISHLSPRNRWDNNLKAAYDLIQTGDANRVFNRSKELAKKALNSKDPLSTINGPKCSAFARNILGQEDCVTLDVWMAKAALGDAKKGKLFSNKKFYSAVERAVVLASARVGETPRDLQAIVWLVERANNEGK